MAAPSRVVAEHRAIPVDTRPFGSSSGRDPASGAFCKWDGDFAAVMVLGAARRTYWGNAGGINLGRSQSWILTANKEPPERPAIVTKTSL